MQRFVVPFRVAGVLLLLGTAGCPAPASREAAPGGGRPPAPPVPVVVAEAVSTNVPLEIRTFGLIEANASVAIRSQITGRLLKIHVKEGQDVREGEPLFTIDDRPYAAALKQAEANLARDRAQLADARREADRQKGLLEQGLAAVAEADRARTVADSLAAAVQAGEAAVENARVQVDYCSIVAPMAGRTGERLADEGNLVRANDAVLLTIHQVRPAQVSFTVPQAEAVGLLARAGGPPLRVRVTVPGAEDRPETGDLFFVDNAVDAATGALRCKARFDNAAGSLWPGLYVKVALELGVEKDAIVVPAQAVQTGQQGAYVFVAGAAGTVDLRPVKMVREHEGRAVLGGGLKAGERVVTDGQVRLTPGARYEVRPAPGGGGDPRA